uniref:Uncharacterized protein n=1 Tax=Anguilla anguilla TaxID=7936 RepID=A0A0E9TE72_ANGAN
MLGRVRFRPKYFSASSVRSESTGNPSTMWSSHASSSMEPRTKMIRYRQCK